MGCMGLAWFGILVVGCCGLVVVAVWVLAMMLALWIGMWLCEFDVGYVGRNVVVWI